MNMFKKNGGFTLVELIVVIAILAILAGVAVPAYSGYISKANEAADYTMLDGVKTAAVFAAIEKTPDAKVTKIEVGNSSSVIVYTDKDADGDTYEIKDYIGTTTISYKATGVTGATWDGTTAKWTLTKSGS